MADFAPSRQPAPRGWRQAGALAVLAIALALVGCGGGGSTTTIVERTVAGDGPRGPLTADGVGPAKLGMSRDEVRGLFGEPDGIEPYVNEPAGKNEPGAIWRWGSGDVAVRLRFDGASDHLEAYTCTDASLETAAGIGVDDARAKLVSAYGDRLKPDGLGNLSLPRGSAGTNPQIVFGFEGSYIAVINGGNVEYAE